MMAIFFTPSLACFANTILTVKLIKDHLSRCSSMASIKFPENKWHLINKPYFYGENDREIFFEIESDLSHPALSDVTITAPGVTILRAIVGRTDVPFKKDGNAYTLRLVNDKSEGQMMQTDYQSPRGGLPISFRHDWKMRRSGKYASDPYPLAQIEATPNYLLAAQEVLRLMGYSGQSISKRFQGQIVLMGSENATTRGHLDYPPHFHIMHYEFAETRQNSSPKWLSRLAPHFYMDDAGKVILNHESVIVGTGSSSDFGLGKTCTLRDSKGNFVLAITITPEGLSLADADNNVYSLHPDPVNGATKAVYGYHGKTPLFRIESHDDAERGHFSYQLDTIQNGKIIDTFKDGYEYDPFTSKIIKR